MTFVNVIVTCNLNASQRDVRLPLTATVAELKGRCELLTGVLMSSMQLQLRSPQDNSMIADLTDATKTLSHYGGVEGIVLHVIDPTGGAASISDSGDVEKFELSDDAYEKRTDSVRAFKQKHGLGRFDADAQADRAKKEAETFQQGYEVASTLSVGQRCEVRVANHPPRRGAIAFIGETKFRPGPWIGIKYDEPLGKNDGTVEGVRYFTCDDKYGGFCRPQDLAVGDFPPEFEDMDEF